MSRPTRGSRKFDLIRCGDHQMAPWHMVCIHINRGLVSADQWVLIPLSPDDTREVEGDYLCRDCARTMQNAKPDLELLNAVCMHCMNDIKRTHGYTPADETDQS